MHLILIIPAIHVIKKQIAIAKVNVTLIIAGRKAISLLYFLGEVLALQIKTICFKHSRSTACGGFRFILGLS